MATTLTIRRVGDRDAQQGPRSELLVQGKATGKFVPGAILEAAIESDGRYLVFLTDDTPFEDMLSIHLLDSRLDVLDSAVIGARYVTGTFSALELHAPNSVRFRFAGDTTWSVELLPRPGLRMPFHSDPRGVKRRPGITRHFIVRGDPRPETH